jgi:hypothetical protein
MVTSVFVVHMALSVFTCRLAVTHGMLLMTVTLSMNFMPFMLVMSCVSFGLVVGMILVVFMMLFIHKNMFNDELFDCGYSAINFILPGLFYF